MRDDMGTFRVDVEIENPARPGDRRTLQAVLVDTGAELSWVPTDLLDALGVQRHNKWLFRQAEGRLLERWTGGVFMHVAGKVAGDEVVLGRSGSSMRARPQRPSSNRSRGKSRWRTLCSPSADGRRTRRGRTFRRAARRRPRRGAPGRRRTPSSIPGAGSAPRPA